MISLLLSLITYEPTLHFQTSVKGWMLPGVRTLTCNMVSVLTAGKAEDLCSYQLLASQCAFVVSKSLPLDDVLSFETLGSLAVLQ